MLQFVSRVFHEGDLGMWPILAVFLVSLSLIIERSYLLFVKMHFHKHKFVHDIEQQIMHGHMSSALSYSARYSHPIAKIVKAGLLRVNQSDTFIQSAMDEEALKAIPQIERRTGYLAMLANVATLLGLLGTIGGLIRSFSAISQVEGAEKSVLLSRGISEAMNCTAFGLIVAIISLIAYAILQSRVQHLIDDIAEVSVSLLNLVTHHRHQLKLPVIESQEGTS